MLLWSSFKCSNRVAICGVVVACVLAHASCQQIPREERAPLEAEPNANSLVENTEKEKPVDRIEWPDEPLDDTPSAVTFLSLVRAPNESLRAKVRIFNFAEQDLSQLVLELSCKDVDGRSIPCIKPWSTSRSVPARSHVTHVISAHLPAETDSIDINVIEAKFTDGRNWPEKD